MRSALSLALVLAFVGCGEDASPNASAPEPAPDPGPRGETTRDPVSDQACSLGPARPLTALPASRGLATGATWVAALDERLVVQGPMGMAVPLEHDDLTDLLRLTELDEAPLVIALGQCGVTLYCVSAIDLWNPRPLDAPLPSALTTFRLAEADDAVYLAWSGEGGTRGLERWSHEGRRLVHRSIPLGSMPASEEAPVEILGASADGEGWAVVWRRGPTEDARSEVYVSGPDGDRPNEALHEALAIESIALEGGVLSLIVAFEFARPGFLRIDGDDTQLRILSRGNAPPAPFEERVRASLEIDQDGLWLNARDGAGDSLGEGVLVAPRPVESATIERRGETFEVAWSTPARGVFTRTARCPIHRGARDPLPAP